MVEEVTALALSVAWLMILFWQPKSPLWDPMPRKNLVTPWHRGCTDR